MSYQTPKQYCHNKYIQENTEFKIVCGFGFYVENDELVSKQEFEAKYPINLPIITDPMKWKGSNPDKTRII